jgi:hypothetical protein
MLKNQTNAFLVFHHRKLERGTAEPQYLAQRMECNYIKNESISPASIALPQQLTLAKEDSNKLIAGTV